MTESKRIYWDACAWIAVINEDRAVPTKGGGREDHFAMCEAVLECAGRDEVEIVTSTFTFAEVCKEPKIRSGEPSSLSGFLKRPFVLSVPLDRNIGEKSQILQMSGQYSGLKPPDAVHLATAQRANCEEFHTFDGKLLGFDGKVKADNGQGIKICKPS